MKNLLLLGLGMFLLSRAGGDRGKPYRPGQHQWVPTERPQTQEEAGGGPVVTPTRLGALNPLRYNKQYGMRNRNMKLNRG